MYTISRLGELFGISRSTLLYYEKIGLLTASNRNSTDYRLYSEEDKTRLQQIMIFRSIGVPLLAIKENLAMPQEGIVPLLMNRLFGINNQIDELRSQQKILFEMIEADGSLKGKKPFLDKMHDLGKKAGVHEGNYEKIHRIFERTSPDSHKKFLAFLGFNESEIKEFIKKLKEKV